MNASKTLYKTVMRLAMNKIIEQGEYYNEDDNGPCFELSADAKNYTRLVAESLDRLCKLVDDGFGIGYGVNREE
jgi:hypothetical protein